MSALSVLRDRLKDGRKAFRGLGSPEAILKAFRLGSQRNGIYVAAHGASGAFPIKTPVFLFAPFSGRSALHSLLFLATIINLVLTLVKPVSIQPLVRSGPDWTCIR